MANQFKVDAMSQACRMCADIRNAFNILVGESEGKKDHTWEIYRRGEVSIKIDLKK
jgi:hypothetical protein